MTIRTKLALWYSGLLAAMIVILSVTVIAVSRVSTFNGIDQMLEGTAQEVEQNTRLMPVSEFGTPEPQVVFGFEEIFSTPGVFIQVWQTFTDGETPEPVLIRSSLNLAEQETALDASQLRRRSKEFTTNDIHNVYSRVITTPFYDTSGNQLGVIQVSRSLQEVQQANDALIVITLIAATISITIAMILSMWVSGRVLKPVERITEAARGIAQTEDLATRLEWHGPMDELGQLTDVFNHMMERLEHLFSVQQRFVGDVSHELRTPLTSILGHLEIMQRYGVDDDSLDAVHREANRMSRMVNDLLLLHRADFGELEVDLYPVDLDTVALEVYEQLPTLSQGRDLKLTLEKLESARINGNVDRLKQLLLNLLGNAIKFTADGGEVALSVWQEDAQAIIEVRDTGIGISETDLRSIFDRFFQADYSRVHRTESDGAGLGLSIVRWIVEIHNGTVEVSSEVGQGTRFRVVLPLLNPEHHAPPDMHMMLLDKG